MRFKFGKALLIIGCIMVGIFICGLFNGGTGFISAAFHGKGTPKIIGIIYLVLGGGGVILAIIGFFLNPPELSSSSKPTSSSAERHSTDSGSDTNYFDDDVTPIESSPLYEKRTLRDDSGNTVDVEYNTVRGVATDWTGREYTTSDGKTFYSVENDENDDGEDDSYYDSDE